MEEQAVPAGPGWYVRWSERTAPVIAWGIPDPHRSAEEDGPIFVLVDYAPQCVSVMESRQFGTLEGLGYVDGVFHPKHAPEPKNAP